MEVCSLKRLVIVFCFLIHSRTLFTTGCDRGRDCCNCKDSTECVTFTGRCTSGCKDPSPSGYGWTGQWCHISNIALSRPAEQSSTYHNNVATRAVDGNTNSNPSIGYCSHTERDIINGQYPWWRVDLGVLSHINTVTIHNRGDCCSGRLNHFYVRVGNDKDISSHTQCDYHLAAAGATVTITCNKQGRYVSVQLSKDTSDGPILQLCEVVVLGYKFKECPAGKKPSVTCEEDCNNGNYGSWCNGVCGRCKDSKACNKQTGACPDGCEIWYVPGDCSIELRNPGPARKYKVKSTTSSSITIQWDSPTGIPQEGATYLKYVVSHRQSGIINWIDHDSPVQHYHSNQQYEATFTGLNFNTKYELKISPRYIIGDQERRTSRAETLYGTTALSPCTAPEIQNADYWRSADGKTVMISWKVTSGSGCDSLNAMTLAFGQDRNSLTSEQLDTATGTRTKSKSNLDPHKDYYYKLTARNNDNLSYSTNIKTVPAITTTTSTTTTTTTPQPTPKPTPVSTKSPTPATVTVNPSQPPPTKATYTAQPPITTTAVNGTGGTVSTAASIQPPSQIGPIIGVIVGVLVLIIIIIILVVILVRRRKTSGGFLQAILKKPRQLLARKDKPPKATRLPPLGGNPSSDEDIPVSSDEEDEDELSKVVVPKPPTKPKPNKPKPPAKPEPPAISHDPEELVYANTSLPIKLSKLEEQIEQKNQEKEGFKNEFLMLPKDLHQEHKFGLLTKDKNRFANIIAYDHSRVVLDEIPGERNSTYVNASFIKGYGDKKNHYIAAQGPKPNTLPDFWRLVWQEKVNRIVMVTRVLELGTTKCEQYWPNKRGEAVAHGEISITLAEEDFFATYTLRVFNIVKGTESRVVKQINYTGWPDKHVPEFATSLLDFRRKVRGLDAEGKGPLLVHCSAGVGRTGTFIALDILLEQAKQEDIVDPYGVTYRMRQDRVNMIQTLDQYIFLHNALVEGIKSGETAIPCADFLQKCKNLCLTWNKKDSTLHKQFESLNSMKVKRTDSMSLNGLSAKNLDKNRNKDIVPIDAHRPYLMTRVEKTTDYINAVYVEAYKKRSAFLLTQMPLPHTVVDVWRLIHDYKCRTIITAVQMQGQDKTVASYWPEQSSTGYGPFQVTLNEVDEESFQHMTVREMSLKHKKEEPLKIKQYHLECWPKDKSVPQEAKAIVELYEQVKRWQQRSGNGVILIQCEDGATRSGLVCAASVMLERIECEKEVDVFTTIKSVRSTRPQLVPTLEQYKFCHEIAAAFMEQNDIYMNFR